MSKYDDDEEDDRDRNRSRGRRRDRDDDDYEDDRDERRSSKRRRDRDEDDYEDDRDERRSPSRRRARDEDDDDRDDDYEDERKPRPGVCPKCGSRRSSKVSFTWWGGLVGPAMFNLVQCSKCGQQYNAKKGTAVGALHITLYSLVGLVIAVGVLILIGAFR
jgi:hypothetical protein